MARKEKKPKAEKARKAPKTPKAQKPLETRGSRIIGNPVRVLIILAIISAVLGVALFQFYESYKSYFDYMIGGLIILIGLVSIVFYFAKKTIDGVYRYEFAVGILCIAFGTYVALNGGASFSFLVIIGAMCAFDGVIKLQYSLDLARMRFKAWWLPLIFAVLGIAIGVVILMGIFGEVFGEGEGISMAGIALCVNALFDIICAIVIAVRNRKAAKNAQKQAEIDAAVKAAIEAGAVTAVTELAAQELSLKAEEPETVAAEPVESSPAETAEPAAEPAAETAEAPVE